MILLPLMIWYARRSEPISIRDLQRLLAILLVTFCLMPSDAAMHSCNAEEMKAGMKAEVTQLLREGTQIPPTTGRIVMLGRRWAFVPVSAKKMMMSDSNPSSISKKKMMKKKKMMMEMMMEDESNPSSLPQILLQENLILQRVVKAINFDSNDDHWIISGEVTEFFNENRLTIRLAQRTSRH